MLRKIVSGGQTGVDRAALDWALARGFPCGGWCPAGRRAEDGNIPAEYPLTETPSAESSQRTEWNVRDSDATLIVALTPDLEGGTALTAEFAAAWNRPCLILSRSEPGKPGDRLMQFIDENRIETLNVAGPRASGQPGVGAFAATVLDEWLALRRV